MTCDQLHELAEHRDGHFAVESAGGGIHIYMMRRGHNARLVATRSTAASAIALIRQRRDAHAQCEADLRREFSAHTDRLLAAGRPPAITQGAIHA